MAEGTEKSITERIEDTRRWQACEIQAETVSSPYVWDCRRLEHKDITDENIKEHVEECLGEMLNYYIDDEINYILDGAVIKCDQMSDGMVCVQFTEDGSKISIEDGEDEEPISSDYVKPADIGPDKYNFEDLGEWFVIPAPVNEKSIRKLHAAFGNSQSDNGIRFATVADRSYLREEEEKLELKTDTASHVTKVVGVGIKGVNAVAKENRVSIVSCGHCKKLEKEDLKKIAENWSEIHKYGTCYALMQLASSWTNPYCMESVVGECKGEDFLLPFSGVDILGNTQENATCMREHHRPMKFSTLKGEKEGLTMMSTLLCGKGGIITINASGQIYVEPKNVDEEIGDIEERIEQLVKSVAGEPVNSSEKLKGLSTMEILSRLIYQEQGTIKYQDSIIFSIVNRLFSNTSFSRRTNTNNIYSVITGLNQYESIEINDKEYPNAFNPPNQYDSATDQASWENAKRLAAILCIAIEEYGEPNENTGEKERDEKVVRKGDEETYQKVVDFLEQQNLINEIEGRDSFYGTTKGDKYNIGGNLFYYQ